MKKAYILVSILLVAVLAACSKPDATELENAMKSRNLDQAKEILKKNPKLAKTPEILYKAIDGQQPELAVLLIENGADVKSKEKSVLSRTPLHAAAFWGYAEIARLLLAKGADLYAEDSANQTAMDLAITGGYLDIVELFVGVGYDMNRKDSILEDTVVHEAVNANRKEILAFFILKGANLNIKNKNGQTPLAMAIQDRKEELADILRRSGASE